VRVFWWLWLVLLCLPGLWAVVAVVIDIGEPGRMLGADAPEALLLHFGEWGLRILLATLCFSSLRRRVKWQGALTFRRMTGLAAFTYLSLHFLVYLALFAAFSLQQILVDLTERAYITAGFAAWLVLLALAATSTRGWQRRLRRNWLRLHRLVYVAIPLGLLHLLWLTKAGYVEALAYGLVYAVLMLERWPGRWRRSPVP
jgi:sulfoxide reductase heme-binding subunit YedZ